MAEQLPSGVLAGFDDLTAIEVKYLNAKVLLGNRDIEALPGGHIFISIERRWPQRDYNLYSIGHAMTYPPVRRSIKKFCSIYNKMKRNNCIASCYLKTMEIVLQEIFETCEPFIGHQINMIDESVYLGMHCIEELLESPVHQVLPVMVFYKSIIQQYLQYRCFVAKERLRTLILSCMNVFPTFWAPEPVQIPHINGNYVMLDE